MRAEHVRDAAQDVTQDVTQDVAEDVPSRVGLSPASVAAMERGEKASAKSGRFSRLSWDLRAR